MAKSSIDPLRTRLNELLEQLQEHTGQLRDYASIPGNAWLAKGEIQAIERLSGDIEGVLDEIRDADAENGY